MFYGATASELRFRIQLYLCKQCRESNDAQHRLDLTAAFNKVKALGGA